jgi:CheY-like chemotaxis protein
VLQRGGLGIAITRQLTQMLGGSLNVKSIQDQGTTFTASVSGRTPSRDQWISSAEITEKKSSAERRIPHLAGRVLLAEDNLVNQKLIARIIGKTGAEAVVVSDGEQARNAALSEPFDLILMDVNMPVLGGLEATRILREKGYGGPIYALTAEHGLEEIRASMNAGCNGHLTKPVDLEAFYDVLTSHLHEQEAQNA